MQDQRLKMSKTSTAYGQEVPEDRFGLVYMLCFFLGLGTLFPWNVLINNTVYFDERFCGTAFASEYLNYISIAFNMCVLLGFGVTYYFGEAWSLHSRIVKPVSVVGFVLLTLSALVLVDIDGTYFFIIIMVLTMICGFFSAIFSVFHGSRIENPPSPFKLS